MTKNVDVRGLFGDSVIWMSVEGDEELTQREMQFIWRCLGAADLDDEGRKIAQSIFRKLSRAYGEEDKYW